MTPVSIFLSYARSDDEPFVKRLYADLTKAGFTVWFDRESLLSRGLTYHQEIKDAIRTGVNRVVYVGGPKAAMSQHVREEWQFALECDHVVVTPILRLGEYEHVPGELSLLHCEDFRDDAKYDAALAKLITSLREPNPKLGALFALPNLPPNFLGRPELMRRVRDALLVDLQKPQVITSADARVGMQGMGGIGKSVLAAALGRNRQVRQAYPDGVIWIACGQKLSDDDLVKRQRDLARHLGGDENFASLAQGQGVLRPLLAAKAVLLVLDDVWRAADAQAFDVVGPRCRMLVTTRDKGILDTLHGELVPVSLFTEPEALQLLADAVNVAPDALSAEAREVARECGFLPLALALCGGMAKSGHAWSDIVEALREADLEWAENREAVEQHRTIWNAMKVSYDALPDSEKPRFAELAVFVSDQAVPEAAAATLWEYTGQISARNTSKLLINLTERSLIQLDQKTDAEGKVRREFRLHDLLHDYAVRIAGEPRAVHQKLLDAYRKKCSDGWYTGPNDGYFFQWLPVHLSQGGMTCELGNLLIDFRWIQAKLDATNIPALESDYDIIPGDMTRKLIRDALRLSAHVLSVDKTQLASQLTGRLMSFTDNSLQRLLGDAHRYASGMWLRPLSPSLTAPGGPLLRVLEGHTFGVNHAVLDAQGLRAVSASDDKTLRVWNLATGACERVLAGHTGVVWHVALDAQGLRAVSASRDNALRVWTLATGACERVLEGHSNWVGHVALDAQGLRAVSASSDKTLRVWNLATGACERVLEGHTEAVNHVALDAQGLRAVSASKDYTLRVWMLATGACERVLEGHKREVNHVALDAQGLRAVSASEDGTLRVWNLATGACERVLYGHTLFVRHVALDAQGMHAVSASWDNTLRVWTLATGACERVLQGHTDPVDHVALDAQGLRAVSASVDGTLRVWNLATGACERVLEGHSSRVHHVALDAQGLRAVSASGNNTLRVWTLAAGACERVLEGHTHCVDHVALDAQGLRAVSASRDNTLRVWTLATGACERVLEGHTEPVLHVALDAQGLRAVSASWDNTLRVWTLATGACERVLKGHSSWVGHVALDAQGLRAVSASEDNTLRVWNLATGSCERVLKGHTGPVLHVALDAQGLCAVSASYDKTLRVWNLATGACECVLEGHTEPVKHVALDAQGLRAVSASVDKTPRVWNLATGACERVLEGHTGPVLHVALDAQGLRAVSTSQDNTLRVWDLSTGICMTLFSAETGAFTCDWTTDGHRIVAGDNLGRMHILQLEGLLSRK